MLPPRHRSSATPLAVATAVLVVYASLYPFTGWEWPASFTVWDVARLPWPVYRIAFDIWSNLLGYLPLGFLIAVAAVRSGQRSGAAWLWAVVVASGLSYAMEVAQQFIPLRYPSALDWLLNSVGAALGALLAALMQALGLLERWQVVRDRWLIRQSRGALTLLVLWPLGLLFPTPFPLGVGLGWERIQDALVGWLVDVAWAQDLLELVSDVPVPMERPALVVSGLGVVFGLLAPCLVAYSVIRPGWRRLAAVLVMGVAGVGASTLSALLNFGPGHAWGWVSPEVLPSLGLAVALLLPLALVGQRLAAALGVVILIVLTTLVAQVPADPYFATSLQAWEQGRFIRFHGLAQWIGWWWPYAALVWLLSRLSRSA